MTPQVSSHTLYKIFNDFINHYLSYDQTYVDYAEAKGITVNAAKLLLEHSRLAADRINDLKRDERFEVKYIHMGAKMHNYQVFFNDVMVAYARSEDEGWGLADEYYTGYLVSLVK